MSWRRPPDPGIDESRKIDSGDYRSALFESFVGGLERLGSEAPILDLGPTTPDNLVFWATRGHRVAAVDLAARLGRGAPIDPDPGPYGGVLCWNTLALLDRDECASLIEKLRRSLLPGGYLFAIFDGDGRTKPPPLRYRIGGESRLRFEPIDWPTAPRAVPTNEIESLLEGLRPTRLTVMRHGSREALGQKPRPVPQGL